MRVKESENIKPLFKIAKISTLEVEYMNKKNLLTGYTDKEKKEIEQLASEYKEFLNNGKTEREVVEITIEILEKNGFKDIEKVKSLKAGDKIFYNNRNKNILMSIIGKENMKKGINI